MLFLKPYFGFLCSFPGPFEHTSTDQDTFGSALFDFEHRFQRINTSAGPTYHDRSFTFEPLAKDVLSLVADILLVLQLVLLW